MIGTIDKAGRVVVPKEIRQILGFVPGNVEITVLGNQALIKQSGSRLCEKDGHLVLPLGGPQMSTDELRELRLADQR
ncbi:MAG: AbrB/MazE/SpoVT family DNA-binding domain-containing protein [Propionibacteriaceae bacterium]|nr:AbrB/MazE/SpoVT family DNA-binding domain-containing protein [Propionibacteriaceae bacterium]